MPNYHILSIDGGGMKALISAIVIEHLENTIQRLSHDSDAHIADYFDLIAGTSAGAILAGIYLCPGHKCRYRYHACDAVEFLSQYGQQIFKNSFFHRLSSLHGLAASKYQNKNLKQFLSKFLGNVRLAEIKQPCLFPSYNLETGNPFFFNSVSARINNSVDFMLYDAILASCAAPTYFPPVCITSFSGKTYTMVDGGLASNNPALCALVESMKMPGFTSPTHTDIFSVGNVSEFICHSYSKAKNWGLIEWALPLLDIFLSSNTSVVSYELKMLYDTLKCHSSYVRIEKKVCEKKDSPSLDDASSATIKRLIKTGHALVNENHQKIEAFAKQLINS